MKTFSPQLRSLLTASAQKLPIHKRISIKIKIPCFPSSGYNCPLKKLSYLSTSPLHHHCRHLCASRDQGSTDADPNSTRSPETKNDEETLSAFELSQQFDPPAKYKRALPDGIFGTMQMHFSLNVSLLTRVAVSFQRMFFTYSLDPSFSFDEFLEGAEMAYRIIRQISSNVKDPAQLDLLREMVDTSLLKVLKSNIADMSVVDKNHGREVHDVYGEVVWVALQTMDADRDGDLSHETEQARRRYLLERAEWLQIRVRFLALEVPTVRAPPATADELPAEEAGPPRRERGAAEVIASTWTFEGRLWNVAPLDPTEDVPARWRKARTRNPDLVWRLVKISV